jgi:hypothetical protein
MIHAVTTATTALRLPVIDVQRFRSRRYGGALNGKAVGVRA